MTRRPKSDLIRMWLSVTLAVALSQGCLRRDTRPEEGISSGLFAFSLRRAEDLLRSGDAAWGDNLLEAAGVHRLAGVVYDDVAADVVLIGRPDASAPPMRLDDLAVALRALLVHRRWPLVSIDATPETETTGRQAVRLEGGLEDSLFGHDLLAADVVLKRLCLGTKLAPGVSLVSYFDLRAQRASARGLQSDGSCRMWFQVVDGAVEERDGVWMLRRLQVGVKAELTGERRSATRDTTADDYAAAMTKSYRRLAAVFPEVARLNSLYEAVAAAEAIRNLPDADANASYWLNQHPVPAVPTPRNFPLESRQEIVKTGGGSRTLRISGGIQLRALTLRLQDGDVTALKEAVLLSRPSPSTLNWPVPLEDWGLQGASSVELPADFAEKLGSELQWNFLDAFVESVEVEPPYEPRILGSDGYVVRSSNATAQGEYGGGERNVGGALNLREPAKAQGAPSEDRGGVALDPHIRQSDFEGR